MGEVFVKAKVINPKLKLEKDIEFLVDTGATLSVIPEPILNKLKVIATDKDVFELADGKHKTFKLGEVIIKVNGKRGTFKIAFGSAKTQPLLGQVVMETLGFRVDPVTKKLIKRRLLMYKTEYKRT